MRRAWAGIAIVVLVIAGVVVWRQTRGSAAPRYLTAPVTRGDVARTVTASGTINPVVTVQVGSYVSGAIEAVYCDYNTTVKKGQLCAKIDPRPYQTVVDEDQANVAAARAQLQKDQTNLQYAQLAYQRNLELSQRGLVSQDQLDQLKTTADQAKAQVAVDQTGIAQRAAALKAAQVNLDYTNITSPVDGTVVSRNITTGQTVAASFQTPTLFLIATDLTKMQVDTSVSESDIGGIRAGTSAAFSVEAFPESSFFGQVTQVRQAPQTVQNVVTYDVVVSADNSQDQLKPGMTATVHIAVDERKDVVRVPDQALRYMPGGVSSHSRSQQARPVGTSGQTPPSAAAATAGRASSETGDVWVLRDGHPVQVPVTIGLDDGSNAEIVSGDIRPGDRVIVSEQAQGSQNGRTTTPRLRF